MSANETAAWTPAAGPPPLASDHVHVWRFELDRVDVTASRGLLAPDEVARAGKLQDAGDAARFVAGRGTLRRLLGVYLGRAPAALELAYGKEGKPCLAGGDAGRLEFNLSHSGDTALLGVARRPVGVDLERIDHSRNIDAIFARFFSSFERMALSALTTAARVDAFYTLWTRKEAFIKARGDGVFAIQLDRFDVSVAPGEPPQLLRMEGEPDAPARWSLHALPPIPGFAAALAVAGVPARVECFALARD